MIPGISPAVVQYATIVTLPRRGEDEIATTGLINSAAQVWGMFLIVAMSAVEDVNHQFSMRLANWMLLCTLLGGLALLWMVDDSDNGTHNARLVPTEEDH